MQHSFVGRKRELQMLGELFKKKSASLVVIRGRRRIGKSRLAQEFAQKTSSLCFFWTSTDEWHFSCRPKRRVCSSITT